METKTLLHSPILLHDLFVFGTTASSGPAPPHSPGF